MSIENNQPDRHESVGVHCQVIPPITEPLGRYWEQPNPKDILIDEHFALMIKKDFDKLHNYEYSNPTGIYLGKMWRRNEMLVWCDYGTEDYFELKARKILVV